MRLCSMFLLAACLSSSSALSTVLQTSINPSLHTYSTIRDILLDAKVIGDVLGDFEPTYYIDLAYPKAHEAVLLGNDIPVKAVSTRPTFNFHSLTPTPTEKNSTFTLVLTDPDATSRADPTMSEMCHWVLTNLTTRLSESALPTASGYRSLFLDISSKKEGELESYYPPAPPPKTGRHRYVFALLEGQSRNIRAPEKRQHWGYGKIRHGVKDWAKDNDLTVVGANFFYAANQRQ